jgi:N-acyl-D-aspartate/D-glutamate deacylase
VLDLLIRGGTIVDGTGAPARVGDVGVRDGRIVPADGEAASRTIDADGLVVAPGFVDIHTHYDAQLLWDPTASPSPLHGVTTVIGGNCGFALAPLGAAGRAGGGADDRTRDAHADYLARLMARVEGIPLAALLAGVPWDWATYDDYLSRFDGRIAVNAGFLAGHSVLRRLVMGERSVGADATDDDIAAMAQLLDACLTAGALGFSTSQASTHNDGDGQPVPSRAATVDELVRLAAVCADHPGTQLECIIQGCLSGFTDDEVALMAEMSRRADRPINWNVLAVRPGPGSNHEPQLGASARAAELGGRVVALTLPGGAMPRLSFFTGFALDGLPGWRDTLGLPIPERTAALGDPAVRARLLEGSQSPAAGSLGVLAAWDRMVIMETPNSPYEGRSVGELAAEEGRGAFDVLLDIVIGDDLRTGFQPCFPAEPDDAWKLRADVWRDPYTVVGGSDAGAHLDMMCGATYSTFLVGECVRDKGVLSIEEAVHQLADVPARLYGLTGRGRIADGFAADLVVFDPASVAPGELRTRDDLPGGAERLYADATGVEHVVVNGVEIARAGAFTGDTPGTTLRSGRDTETVHAAG